MDRIVCTIVSADETSREIGEVDLQTALQAFRSFPWQEQISKVEQAGCYPTLSLGAGPRGEDGYLNVAASLEPNAFMVMIATYKPGTVLGFIPKRKEAFLDLEPVEKGKVEKCLRTFFELPQRRLFDWIQQQNEP